MNIGTDLAGPLFTRYTLKDTSFFKVWIVIFMCTLSRAAHLKLVENSTTEQFLSAFRRFINRRGTPQFLPSDNASNLKRQERTLDYIFKHQDVQQFLATKQIKWSNILAKAPWFSAIYKKLIRTVKGCLKKTLKNSKVTVNELNRLIKTVKRCLRRL